MKDQRSVVNMEVLLDRVRGCTVCQAVLPHPVRPVVSVHPGSLVLIIGQAPGRRVHESGIPWNDPSGDRLREWLGVSREQFYDASLFGLMPMGFCYPGTGSSGDLPPRPECAPLWHAVILQEMRSVRLTVLVGSYARDYYLAEHKGSPLYSSTGRHQLEGEEYFVLPHPSPRNNRWLRQHPNFEGEVVPQLRASVRNLLR